MKPKQILCILISLVLIFTCFSTTLTVSGDLQAEINEKQAEVDDLQKQIDALADKEEEQVERRALIVKQTSSIEAEIELTEDNIERLEAEIDDASVMLEAAEKDIVAKQDEMAARLRAIYIGGTSSYVNLVLESKDFSSFLESLDLLSCIISADKKMLDSYETERTYISESKAELEAKKAELEASKASLEEKVTKLDSNKAEAERLLKKYQQEQEKVQAEMDEQYAALKDLIWRNSQGDFVGGGFLWPVAGFSTVTAYFGQQGKYWSKGHTGMDIAGRNSAGQGIGGKPILACNSGTVTVVVRNGTTGYGCYIVISHGGGISTLYGHMITNSATVNVGDIVTKGQVIGKVGTTGNSTGDHLHLDFIVNQVRVNPADYVSYS